MVLQVDAPLFMDETMVLLALAEAQEQLEAGEELLQGVATSSSVSRGGSNGTATTGSGAGSSATGADAVEGKSTGEEGVEAATTAISPSEVTEGDEAGHGPLGSQQQQRQRQVSFLHHCSTTAIVSDSTGSCAVPPSPHHRR